MRFQLKEYGAEAVAFDTASGDTHYLAPLALALFQLYREFPGLSSDGARHMLAQRHTIEPGLPLATQVDETLDGLCRIGLIRPE